MVEPHWPHFATSSALNFQDLMIYFFCGQVAARILDSATTLDAISANATRSQQPENIPFSVGTQRPISAAFKSVKLTETEKPWVRVIANPRPRMWAWCYIFADHLIRVFT
jgi:hypothetical protein